VSVVEEILEIDPAGARFAPSRPGSAGRALPLLMLQRRTDTVPLLDLATLFHLPASAIPTRQALIVRKSGSAVAFAVQRVLGQQEAVVRPLLDPLVQVRGIVGAADLGNGMPTLVLDLGAFSGPRALPREERAA
jgi:two-component system chemotaxis sensor kinase CheA